MTPSPNRLLPRLALALLTMAALAGPALAEEAAKSDPTPAIARVENKRVCMITNAAFPKDQIPVEVEGKTYYGCCAMCKERLAKDAASRVAVDPISGKSVDKATAVIGAKADASVLYFESVENLEAYAKQLEAKPKS